MRRRSRALRPCLDALDDRCLLSAGLTPQQIATAYGLNAITFGVNGTNFAANGAGQTIAVIDAFHDPYLASDLNTFDRTYGLPTPALQVINQAGNQTNDGWASEEVMDVEWAHALAPAAKILVVEASSDSIPALMAGVQAARMTPGVSVVSMSWGGSEFSGQSAYDGYFTTPAGHTGITFVAAAGDDGARGGAEWPASSPFVLGVGGTTLQVGYGGGYAGESIWSGSSGGTSQMEAEPGYQRATQSSGARTTPDVAFDGDPNTGVMVYSTAPSTGQGSWTQVGGTSLGAPAWAAVVALADQGHAAAGRGTLDGLSQTLPILYTLPSAYFHKIAASTTSYPQRFRFGYGYGASSVTAGLGTPNGAVLVNGLAGVPAASAATSKVTAPTTATKATTTTTTTASTTSKITSTTFSSRLAQSLYGTSSATTNPYNGMGVVFTYPFTAYPTFGTRPRFVFDVPVGKVTTGFGGLF